MCTATGRKRKNEYQHHHPIDCEQHTNTRCVWNSSNGPNEIIPPISFTANAVVSVSIGMTDDIMIIRAKTRWLSGKPLATKCERRINRIVHWFLHNTCCWCAAQYGTVVVINIICVDRFENFYFEIAIRPNAWFFVPMRIHFVHGNNFKIKDEYTARTDSLYMISYHMMLLFDGTNRRRDARALAGKRVKTNDKNNIPYQPVFISY